MSSQIDPVTGLPMYVPPPLEQIPFTKPPFPWNDLTDNPVTPRPTYYGDDSIPTVSTIAGMHPTEPRGQTVDTDGNHALLVNDIGGGGGVVPVGMQTLGGGSWTAHTHTTDIGFEDAPTATIYGVGCSWWWDGTGTVPAHGNLQFMICNSTGLLGLLVASFGFFINGAATGEDKSGSAYFEFATPLDPIKSFLTDGTTNVGVKTFNNSPLALIASASLLVSIV